MKILRFERMDEAIPWAKERLGIASPTGDVVCIGQWDNEGKINAVTLYSSLTKTNLDIHIVAEGNSRFLSRAYFNASFELPFMVLQLPRVTGLIRASNTHSQWFANYIGFTYEGRMRKAFEDGEDLILYGFLREEYLNHPWRKNVSERTATRTSSHSTPSRQGLIDPSSRPPRRPEKVERSVDKGPT